MEVSDETLSSIADELKDRLRFSHVILKSTKDQLVAAKESAAKQKSKTDRRQRASEEELKSLKKKLNTHKKNNQQLQSALRENNLTNEDLKLTLAANEATLKEAQEELVLQRGHWKRRLVQLYEEKKELQTRCCNQEIELQRLKSVSKERIIRDEAQIKQLTDLLYEAEEKLRTLEITERSNACIFNSYQPAHQDACSPRTVEGRCDEISLASCGCPAETNVSDEDAHECGHHDDCSGCVPPNVLDLFKSFRTRNLRKAKQSLQQEYDDLVVDVNTEYKAMQSEKLRQHKKQSQKIMRALRRRCKQREPYTNVISRERVSFLQKRLEKCQERLRNPDSKCSQELRSLSYELTNIAHQFERSLL